MATLPTVEVTVRWRRSFQILSESYYSEYARTIEPDVVDQIIIEVATPEAWCGAFAIRWKWLDSELVPRLEVFDDAWKALAFCRDLLDWMVTVNNKNVSPQVFAEALRGMGMEDSTERTRPEGAVDRSDAADARRFRWLLKGNDCYMEQYFLGAAPFHDEESQDGKRREIDAVMAG